MTHWSQRLDATLATHLSLRWKTSSRHTWGLLSIIMCFLIETWKTSVLVAPSTWEGCAESLTLKWFCFTAYLWLSWPVWSIPSYTQQLQLSCLDILKPQQPVIEVMMRVTGSDRDTCKHRIMVRLCQYLKMHNFKMLKSESITRVISLTWLCKWTHLSSRPLLGLWHTLILSCFTSTSNQSLADKHIQEASEQQCWWTNVTTEPPAILMYDIP